MPRIPYGTEYTATVSGTTWKSVVCENCGCQFVYRIKHSASGSAESLLWLNNSGAKAKAYSRAEDKLKTYLDKAVRVYACPDCGFFQTNMIQEIRNRIWRKGIKWGTGVFLVVALFTMSLSQSWLLFTTVASLFVSALCLRKLIGLEPDRNASERKDKKISEKYPVIRKSELDDYWDLEHLIPSPWRLNTRN